VSPADETCPSCGASLGSGAPPAGVPQPDAAVVVAMRTTKRGLLPLAAMTLDQHGIEYTLSDSGIADQIVGYRSTESIGETESPLEVLVRAEDAERARDLLRDLELAEERSGADATPTADEGTDGTARQVPPVAHGAVPPGSVALFDASTGVAIGQISEAQLESLAEHLEEESIDDDDYYIDTPTLTMLEENGVEASLVALLRNALGTRQGMDVRWSRGRDLNRLD
jgi:processive 1,2-diacylglycerol beta-glucosyltransferase